MSYVPPQLAAGNLQGDKFVDADVREGRRRVDATIAELKRAGVDRCTGEVVAGYVAAKVILDRARSGEFDLVVVGTHGNTGLKRMWLGSVAERVIRDCVLPVMTVRGSSVDPLEEETAERAQTGAQHDATYEPVSEPRAVVDRINGAWRAGRVENAASLFHRDVVMLTPAGERIVGRDAVVRRYSEFAAAATVDEYEESQHSVDIFGATAVLTYCWLIAWHTVGESRRERGRDVFVLTLTASGWQVAWRTRMADAANA